MPYQRAAPAKVTSATEPVHEKANAADHGVGGEVQQEGADAGQDPAEDGENPVPLEQGEAHDAYGQGRQQVPERDRQDQHEREQGADHPDRPVAYRAEHEGQPGARNPLDPPHPGQHAAEGLGQGCAGDFPVVDPARKPGRVDSDRHLGREQQQGRAQDGRGAGRQGQEIGRREHEQQRPEGAMSEPVDDVADPDALLVAELAQNLRDRFAVFVGPALQHRALQHPPVGVCR
jgi:hypothetical protein